MTQNSERHVQLGLPWVEPEARRRPIAEIEVSADGLRRRVCVSAWETNTGVRVEARLLSAPIRAPRGYRVDRMVAHIRLENPCGCVVGTQPVLWAMTTDGDSEPGPLSRIAVWVLKQLHGLEWLDHAMQGGPIVRQIEAFARRVTARALQLCDPEALTAARSFHAAARFRIYGLVRRDDSGRLAQMADVCPAALILMGELGRLSLPDGAEALHDSIRVGCKLSRVLDEMIHWWSRAIPTHTGGAMLTNPRAFWRRAPARLSPKLLMRPIPPGVAVNDVPTSDAERLHWWTAIHAVADDSAMRRLEPEAAKRLFGFVSAHAVSLAQAAGDHGIGLPGLAHRLLEFVTWPGGRVPCRRSRPSRVLDAMEHWYGAAYENTMVPSGLKLPAPPVARVSPPGLRVEALRTAGEIFTEGERMKHCAGTLVHRALRGELWFFHARYGTEELTVALRYCAGWVVQEVAGRGDRVPTARAEKCIRCWVAGLDSLRR